MFRLPWTHRSRGEVGGGGFPRCTEAPFGAFVARAPFACSHRWKWASRSRPRRLEADGRFCGRLGFAKRVARQVVRRFMEASANASRKNEGLSLIHI